NSTKLVDFGTSMPFGRRLRLTVFVNPMFGAPEQFSSLGRLTPATDVYAAAGVLVYLLARNRMLAVSPSTSAKHPNMSMRENVSRLPDPKLQDVLRKALDPKSSHRYQTARELKEALEPFAVGGPG